jgi:hypothetical protein
VSEVNFKGADLSETSLMGAKNLFLEQLSNVKTLYKAQLNDELEEQVNEKYPHLLEKPKEWGE